MTTNSQTDAAPVPPANHWAAIGARIEDAEYRREDKTLSVTIEVINPDIIKDLVGYIERSSFGFIPGWPEHNRKDRPDLFTAEEVAEGD
jgi:hypothetical protein